MRVTSRQRKRVKKALQRQADEKLLQFHLSQLSPEERQIYEDFLRGRAR